MTFASLPLNRARFADRFQLALESRNPFLDATTVHFQLSFTRASGADAAGLARQVIPHPGQSRQQILQLRQLNLQTAFAAPSALRENVENELGAIEHFTRKQVFKIASLRRRKFVVENDRSDFSILKRMLDRFGFAFADVVRRGRLL